VSALVLQNVIVLLAVVLSALFIGRKMLATWRSGSCSSGCSGCGEQSCSSRKAQGKGPELVQLGRAPKRVQRVPLPRQ
jgi:hypothetical protein